MADSKRTVIHGRNAVLEAIRAGRVTRIYMAKGLGHDPRLEEIGRSGNVVVIERDRLDAMAPGVNQGVAAELVPRRTLTLRELLEGSPSLLVALDGIQDPHNLGAIIRSAEAAGAQGVVLPGHRSAPLTAVAVKASSGATEWLPIAEAASIAAALVDVGKAGLWRVGLDQHAKTPIWEFDFTQPVCLVIGGEGSGLHRLVRERCDALVGLPLRGKVESLNAAAAATAVLFEVVRQRS